MGVKAKKIIADSITFVFLTCLSLVFLFPIVTVFMNSFKKKIYLRKGKGDIFKMITKQSWTGLDNYKEGAAKTGMDDSIKVSAFVTVFSVIVLLLLTSMTAWYLVRVKNIATSVIYYGFVFSMIVPFQMVMYTMTNFATTLGFNTTTGIALLYVGFGSGMCVFMFSGFVKAIPYDVEEAAMIDGCSALQTFFRVVLPMLKPTLVTVGILETMWIWNDYLLPKLVLPPEIKTIPIAVDACLGSKGVYHLEWLMAMLVVAIIPIIIFYLCCQKHIIKGVAAGAVKG